MNYTHLYICHKHIQVAGGRTWTAPHGAVRAGPWIKAHDTFAPVSPPPNPSAMHDWIHDIACHPGCVRAKKLQKFEAVPTWPCI